MEATTHDNLVKHWTNNSGFMDKYWSNQDLIDCSIDLAKLPKSCGPKSVLEVAK